jgi:hypothetical protein
MRAVAFIPTRGASVFAALRRDKRSGVSAERRILLRYFIFQMAAFSREPLRRAPPSPARGEIFVEPRPK